jgi:hypothetical protein
MTDRPINELAAALAKAQGSMENATMNRVNPHFKSKYADLASVLDAVRKPLSENGLAVVQAIHDGNLKTILMHTSGQWVESLYPLPAAARPQEMGSALTYARRYSLSAITGIAADEDDDANAAESSKQRAPVKGALFPPKRAYELHTLPNPAPPPEAAEPTPVPAPQQEPAADNSTPPPTTGGGLSLLDMARKAAENGNQFFYGAFWDMRTPAERKKISAIKEELNVLMETADATAAS